MVRLCTCVFCTLAIPILAVWGYSLWVRGSHRELSHWRNSMGLTSIILILANWSVELFGWALFLSRVNWPGSRELRMVLGSHPDLYFAARTVAYPRMEGYPQTANFRCWNICLDAYRDFCLRLKLHSARLVVRVVSCGTLRAVRYCLFAQASLGRSLCEPF